MLQERTGLHFNSPGEQLEPKKPKRRQRAEVLPYTIAREFHPDIHVDERGNWHIYWGSGEERIHHGGPEGFDDLEKPIHQHQRVILKYIGFDVRLTEKEARQLGLPPIGFTLIGFARKVKKNPLMIPGESQEMTAIATKLLDSIALFPSLATKDERQAFSQELLKQRRKIGAVRAVRDEVKQRAAARIGKAVDALDKKPGVFADEATKAALDLLGRAQTVIGIVRNTLRRYEILLDIRDGYEKIIRRVFYGLSAYFREWTQEARVIREEEKEEMQERICREDEYGLIGQLMQIHGQPYRRRILSREVQRLRRIPEYLSQGRDEAVVRTLKGAVDKLWRVVDRVEKRKEEERFAQFKLPPEAS